MVNLMGQQVEKFKTPNALLIKLTDLNFYYEGMTQKNITLLKEKWLMAKQHVKKGRNYVAVLILPQNKENIVINEFLVGFLFNCETGNNYGLLQTWHYNLLMDTWSLHNGYIYSCDEFPHLCKIMNVPQLFSNHKIEMNPFKILKREHLQHNGKLGTISALHRHVRNNSQTFQYKIGDYCVPLFTIHEPMSLFLITLVQYPVLCRFMHP